MTAATMQAQMQMQTQMQTPHCLGNPSWREDPVQRLPCPTGPLQKRAANVSQYSRESIVVGKPLGKGSFCIVKEATVPHQAKPVAIKTVRHPSTPRAPAYLRAVDGLSREARFLEKLDHTNIVKLVGVSKGLRRERSQAHNKVDLNAPSPGEDHPADNFILVEKLDSTLDARIETWREEEADFPRICYRYCQWKSIVQQRIPVAVQVAKALQYLHCEQKMIFRDLKIANVGFLGDTVKLFDFGLAVESHETKVGPAGSPRYMAPETLRENASCNSSIDIFTFGLFLWELCTLDTPFEHYNAQQHYDRVIRRGERPVIPEWWPDDLANLLRTCWSSNPSRRPSIREIIGKLKEIAKVQKIRPRS